MEKEKFIKRIILNEDQDLANEKEQQKNVKKSMLGPTIDGIIKEVQNLLKLDPKSEFLYKNPLTSKNLKYNVKENPKIKMCFVKRITYKDSDAETDVLTKSTSTTSCSHTSSEDDRDIEWNLIKGFNMIDTIKHITQFVETWTLTRSTKFVVIDMNKKVEFENLGTRYLVEVHFSKPTPRCPNPLAVAKTYFHINVSQRLPDYYPIMVTYRFQSFKNVFYALGERQMKTNTFQQYFIDNLLHLKLAFFAEVWDSRNPMSSIDKRKKSGAKLTKS